MAITLCIETSGPHCSLALACGERIYTRDELLERSHNQHLLNLLDELFVTARCKPADVELVGFGCGPGSFTGVRIAAAATQAIAFGAAARIVPVPSLHALAMTAAVNYPAKSRFICAVKSRGEAYYLASYLRADLDAEKKAEQTEELTDQPSAWMQDLHVGEDTLVVGGRPGWLPETLQRVHVEGVHPQAGDIVEWVRRQHAQGLSQSPEAALPRYISGDSPWKKSAQR